MSVADHPSWPEYLTALNRLVEAAERLTKARRTGGDVEAAERDHEQAEDALGDIRDRLDDEQDALNGFQTDDEEHDGDQD